MTLEGWVVLYVKKHSDYPSMCSNIVDEYWATRMAREMLVSGDALEVLRVCSAESLREWQVPTNTPRMASGPDCLKAPAGWFCTRGSAHDGPCAAWPTVSRHTEESLL